MLAVEFFAGRDRHPSSKEEAPVNPTLDTFSEFGIDPNLRIYCVEIAPESEMDRCAIAPSAAGFTLASQDSIGRIGEEVVARDVARSLGLRPPKFLVGVGCPWWDIEGIVAGDWQVQPGWHGYDLREVDTNSPLMNPSLRLFLHTRPLVLPPVRRRVPRRYKSDGLSSLYVPMLGRRTAMVTAFTRDVASEPGALAVTFYCSFPDDDTPMTVALNSVTVPKRADGGITFDAFALARQQGKPIGQCDFIQLAHGSDPVECACEVSDEPLHGATPLAAPAEVG